MRHLEADLAANMRLRGGQGEAVGAERLHLALVRQVHRLAVVVLRGVRLVQLLAEVAVTRHPPLAEERVDGVRHAAASSLVGGVVIAGHAQQRTVNELSHLDTRCVGRCRVVRGGHHEDVRNLRQLLRLGQRALELPEVTRVIAGRRNARALERRCRVVGFCELADLSELGVVLRLMCTVGVGAANVRKSRTGRVVVARFVAAVVHVSENQKLTC